MERTPPLYFFSATSGSRPASNASVHPSSCNISVVQEGMGRPRKMRCRLWCIALLVWCACLLLKLWGRVHHPDSSHPTWVHRKLSDPCQLDLRIRRAFFPTVCTHVPSRPLLGRDFEYASHPCLTIHAALAYRLDPQSQSRKQILLPRAVFGGKEGEGSSTHTRSSFAATPASKTVDPSKKKKKNRKSRRKEEEKGKSEVAAFRKQTKCMTLRNGRADKEHGHEARARARVA
jgi:hypothetical protein